jgi:hypothetical protein
MQLAADRPAETASNQSQLKPINLRLGDLRKCTPPGSPRRTAIFFKTTTKTRARAGKPNQSPISEQEASRGNPPVRHAQDGSLAIMDSRLCRLVLFGVLTFPQMTTVARPDSSST